MHPLIVGAVSSLWKSGQHRLAVETAAATLVTAVRTRTGRVDIQDAALWDQVFSFDPPIEGKPRLRWPGDVSDLTVRSMNNGLRSFGTGLQGAVRNVAAHRLAELTEQEGLERLAAISLLARWVDECELITMEPR